MTAQDRAETSARLMFAGDQASTGLGITLDHVAPGAARLSMTVQPRMLNGHGNCHGGFIFTLADSAFAFACNSSGAMAVAAQCSINFLRPVREGDRLEATAECRADEGRTGLYDVRVTVGATTVAEFRGMSRTTGQHWLPPTGPDHAP